LRPGTLALLMVLILALQAVGHVALRLFGPRAGLALSGLFSGFVSSTATIAAMGSRARQEPAQAAACEAGAMLSTAATWAQSLLMLAVVAPPAALALLLVAGAGLAEALASGVWRARSGGPAGANAPHRPGPQGALRLREVATVALLLTGVSLAVSWAQRVFGDAGLLAGVALAALADAQSALPALGALHASGQASTATVLLCVLVAISTNALTGTVTAFVTGDAGFGQRLALSLTASTGAARGAAAVFK